MTKLAPAVAGWATPVPASTVKRMVWLVLAAGLVAFLVRGADQPADPYFELFSREPLAGFEEVAARAMAPDGTATDWCALLAATSEARAQGLMDRTDLAGYDAMVFRFEAPSTGRFYMYRTILPLSIAFIADDGTVLSAADMAPCPATDPSACPTHGATAPYRHTVEVPQGGLAALGLAPGSKVTFGDGPC